MTDIKINDSITSDDGDIDGINLINTNLLNNFQNIEMSSDASDKNIQNCKPLQQVSQQIPVRQISVTTPTTIQVPMQQSQMQRVHHMSQPPIQQQVPIQRVQHMAQPSILQQVPIQRVQHMAQPSIQQQVPIQRVQQVPMQQKIVQQSIPNNQISDVKTVSFNDVVEQKVITPDDTSNKSNIVSTTNLETEIKKIKLGKLMVPRVTLVFTIILIAIGVSLFFATKPKKINKQ